MKLTSNVFAISIAAVCSFSNAWAQTATHQVSPRCANLSMADWTKCVIEPPQEMSQINDAVNCLSLTQDDWANCLGQEGILFAQVGTPACGTVPVRDWARCIFDQSQRTHR